MYDNNITAQEISDYIADMLELACEFFAPPTEEEMEAMAEWYNAKQWNGAYGPIPNNP